MKLITTTVATAVILSGNAKQWPEINCPGMSAGFGDSLTSLCVGNCEVDYSGLSASRKEEVLDQWDRMCFEIGLTYNGNRNIDPLSQADPVSASMSALSGYGCWCNMASSFHVGHGKVQNELDENCRKTHLGYDCIRKDAAAVGSTCETDTDEYRVVTAFTTSGVDYLCQAVNMAFYAHLPVEKRHCAVRLCKVESRFLSWFLTNFFRIRFDAQYIHDTYSGQFDFDSECVQVPGDVEKECCGLYPLRFPYNTDHQECCEHTTSRGSTQYSVVPYGTC